MCEICKRSTCPTACPGYSRALTGVSCVLCGEVVAEEKLLYWSNGFPYCLDCLMNMELEALLRICEKSPLDLLLWLGFSPRATA